MVHQNGAVYNLLLSSPMKPFLPLMLWLLSPATLSGHKSKLKNPKSINLNLNSQIQNKKKRKEKEAKIKIKSELKIEKLIETTDDP